jgi:putative oxidoreductase
MTLYVEIWMIQVIHSALYICLGKRASMKNYTSAIQLYLRLALGIGYLSAGLDRFGAWDALRAGLPLPGATGNISWNMRTSSFSSCLTNWQKSALSLLPSVRYCLAVLLIIGWKTRLSAIGSGILALLFALGMAVGLQFRAPLDYSVYVVSAGSFLLATLPFYRWSVDAAIERRQS